MYDDFVEYKVGSLRSLEARLNATKTNFSQTAAGVQSTAGAGDSTSSTSPNKSASTLEKKGFRDPKQTTRTTYIPVHLQHIQHQSSRDTIICSLWKHYLLLCIPFGRVGTKLYNVECKVQSDSDFFRLLRDQYKNNRSRLRRWLSLRCLTSIRFVQVGILSDLVR